MQTSSELERDSFDRWISWLLAVSTENARPSEQVWRRIVHRVVNLNGTGQIAVQGARSGKPLRAAMRSTLKASHTSDSPASKG